MDRKGISDQINNASLYMDSSINSDIREMGNSSG